jgi:hypothetical protein
LSSISSVPAPRFDGSIHPFSQRILIGITLLGHAVYPKNGPKRKKPLVKRLSEAKEEVD